MGSKKPFGTKILLWKKFQGKINVWGGENFEVLENVQVKKNLGSKFSLESNKFGCKKFYGGKNKFWSKIKTKLLCPKMFTTFWELENVMQFCWLQVESEMCIWHFSNHESNTRLENFPKKIWDHNNTTPFFPPKYCDIRLIFTFETSPTPSDTNTIKKS